MTFAELFRPRRLEAVLPERAAELAAVRHERGGAPWFLQAGLGCGMLVASGLGCGGLAVLVPEAFLLAGVLAAVSSIVSWVPGTPGWVRPLVVASALMARPLFYAPQGHLSEWLALVVELLLLVVNRDPVSRVVAGALAPVWLVALWPDAVAPLVFAVLVASGAALLVARRAVAPLRELLWHGASGGLLFAVAGPMFPDAEVGPWLSVAVGVGAAALAGAVAWGVTSSPVDRAAAIGVPLAVAALAASVPGVPVALAVVALGFLVRSPVLWGLGVASFVGYGAFLMYDLEWGLWTKGGSMMAIGAALVALGRLAGRRS